MKFRPATFLLATVFLAISAAGIFTFVSVGHETTRFLYGSLASSLACYATLWLPIVFAAYSIGRQELTLGILAAFAIAQSIAMGMTYCIYFMCNAHSF